MAVVRTLVAALCLWAAAVPLVAQETKVTRAFVAYDQDGWHANWLAAEQDHAYTGGINALVALEAPFLDRLGRALFWNLEQASYAAGLGGKFRMFTPDNVTLVAEPGPDERPYAGWLTTSFALQQRNARVEDHLGIEFGVVGPASGAAELQRAIHPALGWHTQLRNEPTLNVRVRRAWRFQTAGARKGGLGVQAIPELSTDVGTVFRRATIGTAVRLGFRLPDDFVQPSIDDPGSLRGASVQGSFLLFVRVAGQFVAHNLFLDGNTWVESRSVMRAPVVGVFETGATLQFGPRAAFQWSWTALTDEFTTDTVADSYGALVLRFAF